MKKGFTLVELLIVIIIIGILATMAVPQYQKMVEKAKQAEMLPILRSIINAEQMYYMQNGKFVPSDTSWNYTKLISTNADAVALVEALGIDMPVSSKNDYWFLWYSAIGWGSANPGVPSVAFGAAAPGSVIASGNWICMVTDVAGHTWWDRYDLSKGGDYDLHQIQ